MNRTSGWMRRREFLGMTAQGAVLALGTMGRHNLLAGRESNASALKGPDVQQSAAIQIGIFLGTFRRDTLEARLDAVRACGLECVQVGLDCAGLAAMPDEIP